MTLRLGELDPDARYEAWTRVVERIYREQVNQAWSHYMFRLLRAVFTTNSTLSEEGGFIFRWMVENYVDAALMLIRRELDRQAGTENLRNLLFDMIEHPTVANRARYLSKWGKDEPAYHGLADRAFDRFSPVRIPGKPGEDHIDPLVIKTDLDHVAASAEHLREFAERTRAHRTPEQKIDTTAMTFKVLHDAIADVRGVIAKYYALLTLGSISQWEPVPQYNTLQAFTRPWVVDRVAVQQTIKEPSE
jgi:hypothetical protein